MKCIQALAVSLGTGFTFERPQPWPHECTKALVQENRFQKVTIEPLAAKGARYFAWIHAGEEIKCESGSHRMLNEHGAFAYLFHEDPLEWDGRDVFFPIARGKNLAAVWCVRLHGFLSLLCDLSILLAGETRSWHCSSCSARRTVS